MIDKTGLIGELLAITTSKVVRQVILEHQEYLQKEVNSLLRKKQYDDAYATLARLDDIGKFIKLFEDRLKEVRESK